MFTENVNIKIWCKIILFESAFIAERRHWLLVEYKGVPNNLAWVFTSVVTLNVDILRVPVIAPAPTATPTS
jgi:hypothetical protein